MKNSSDQKTTFIHFRFVIALVLSLSVMALDVRSKFLTDFRFYVESALYPILVFADSPHTVGRLVSSQFKSHSDLIEENERLSTENFMQRADILKLRSLELENQALRQLLNSPVRGDAKKLFAEVIDVDYDPYLHRVLVNRGSKEHVFEGMPVITDKGLVGQVMSVNHTYSRVLLLTDPNCSVPLVDERSSVRAIATGSGSHNEILINNVPRSADVKEGDLLFTSGIGGIYPKGYPVAIVTSVGISESQPFAAIKAKPLVDTYKMRYVLMFWPSEETLAEDDFASKAKQLTDNKKIIHQERVKKLIETLSVHPKKSADKNSNQKENAEVKTVEGSND